MKYNLSVMNRVVLLNLMPQKGSFLDLRVSRDMVNLIGFSAEEQEARGLVENPETGSLKWEDGSPAEFDIHPKAVELIRKRLKELDEGGEIVPSLVEVCEIFEYDGS